MNYLNKRKMFEIFDNYLMSTCNLTFYNWLKIYYKSLTSYQFKRMIRFSKSESAKEIIRNYVWSRV